MTANNDTDTINNASHAILDLDHTAAETMLADVVEGLSSQQRSISPKYLYDDEGSRLFDRITKLDEYYPTRIEAAIMRQHLPEIAERIGPSVVLIEPGAGNGDKAVALANALQDPVAIIPIDISMEYVKQSAEAISQRCPGIQVIPVCGDFTQPLDLPEPEREAASRLLYFPGSTVGNFLPEDRQTLLESLTSLAGPGGRALIGVDLRKSRERLEAAYDDAEGVTAEFNYNLLDRLNRELDAGIDRDAFTYQATWNEVESAVEMFLVSTEPQTFIIGDHAFELKPGERIHTESSYKFTIESFGAEASRSGLKLIEAWTDEKQDFAVVLLSA